MCYIYTIVSILVKDMNTLLIIDIMLIYVGEAFYQFIIRMS